MEKQIKIAVVGMGYVGLSNAVLLKAALPEAKLIVDARCTASNDDGMNEKALDILQGVQVEVQGR